MGLRPSKIEGGGGGVEVGLPTLFYISTQAYVPECECLSELRECDARSNPQLILFEDTADRRQRIAEL